MDISFDDSIKIAGIALVPWNRLGLENWLPDYKIASLFGWGGNVGQNLPGLYDIEDSDVPNTIERFNSQSLLRTPEFQSLLKKNLPGYDLLTYRPVEVPAELSDYKFLMDDPALTKLYENKVRFREMLAIEITMPGFKVYNQNELLPDERTYSELLQTHGANGFVFQDEKLSGGKGTFIVRSFDDYMYALKSLNELRGRGEKVVLSQLIEDSTDVSIQCCVTKTGVYTGPLQRQIVRHPLLCSLTTNGDKFCGAAILKEDQQTKYHLEAQSLAQAIGLHMQTAGYRGVFGVDFLLDEQGKLYVIEVNPRLTGVTPLLNALYKPDDIPFYLLHVLELGDYPYEVAGQPPNFDSEGSILILHALDPDQKKVTEMLPSGTYTASSELVKASDNVSLHKLNEGEFIVQNFVTSGMSIKSGGRLAALYFKRGIIDNNSNKLYNDTLQIIEFVRNRIKLN